MYDGILKALSELPESQRVLVSGNLRYNVRAPNGEWFEANCLFGTFIRHLDGDSEGTIADRAYRTPDVKAWLDQIGLTEAEAENVERLSDGYGRLLFDSQDPEIEGAVARTFGDYDYHDWQVNLDPDEYSFDEIMEFGQPANDYVNCRLRYAHVVRTLTRWINAPWKADQLRQGVELAGAYRLYVVLAGPTQNEWRDAIMGFDNGWLTVEARQGSERASDPEIWTKYDGLTAEKLAENFEYVVRVGEPGIHGRVINLTGAPKSQHAAWSDALELFFARNITQLREDGRPLVLAIPGGMYTAGRLSSNPFVMAHSGTYDLEMYL